MLSHCDLCKETFEPHNRKVHLLFSHFCQDCTRSGNMFQMHREQYFRECPRRGASAGPQLFHQWQKAYDEAHSAKALGYCQPGYFWPRGVRPGNVHEKWQEHQQPNAQQNEWGRKIFQRQHENFKTRANGWRALRPPSPPPVPPPPPPPPHPTQKPQGPTPLDIDNLLEDLVAEFCR